MERKEEKTKERNKIGKEEREMRQITVVFTHSLSHKGEGDIIEKPGIPCATHCL